MALDLLECILLQADGVPAVLISPTLDLKAGNNRHHRVQKWAHHHKDHLHWRLFPGKMQNHVSNHMFFPDYPLTHSYLDSRPQVIHAQVGPSEYLFRTYH